MTDITHVDSNPTSCGTINKMGIIRCFIWHPPDNITYDTPPFVTNAISVIPYALLPVLGVNHEASTSIRMMMIHESEQYLHAYPRGSPYVTAIIRARNSINTKPMLPDPSSCNSLTPKTSIQRNENPEPKEKEYTGTSLWYNGVPVPTP